MEGGTVPLALRQGGFRGFNGHRMSVCCSCPQLFFTSHLRDAKQSSSLSSGVPKSLCGTCSVCSAHFVRFACLPVPVQARAVFKNPRSCVLGIKDCSQETTLVIAKLPSVTSLPHPEQLRGEQVPNLLIGASFSQTPPAQLSHCHSVKIIFPGCWGSLSGFQTSSVF